MKDENRDRLKDLLNRTGAESVCDIMNLVDDIVNDERIDAWDDGVAAERSGVENDMWD